jgi:hypothetical protein
MKPNITILFFGFCFLGVAPLLQAQQFFMNEDEDVIQFSGVVVDADSLSAVPYTSIIIKNTRRGTLSDVYGYFSFVALKNDTIIFSSMGYKMNTFVIPDTITQKRYSMIHVMNADTIMLSPTIIYPWPTQEEFKKAFIELDIPDDDIEIARKNLARAEMKDRMMNYQMDGSMNYKNYMQNETSKLYYAGQSTPITIFNPFAWVQFIKAWKEGKFKRKKKGKY